jgi:hypothetical protein
MQLLCQNQQPRELYNSLEYAAGRHRYRELRNTQQLAAFR